MTTWYNIPLTMQASQPVDKKKDEKWLVLCTGREASVLENGVVYRALALGPVAQQRQAGLVYKSSSDVLCFLFGA